MMDTQRSIEQMNRIEVIKNRIALLKTRKADNFAIIRKLERELRRLEK